jgi:hypothetical protein
VIDILTSAYPPFCDYLSAAAANNIYSDLKKSAEERLREMKRRNRDGLQVETVVHQGFVPDSILAFAQNQHADMIVMGTHGRRGLDRLVMGSVTEYVLRKPPCPVLAVRKPSHDFVNPEQTEQPVHLQKILLCTDFSRCANSGFGCFWFHDAPCPPVRPVPSAGRPGRCKPVSLSS